MEKNHIIAEIKRTAIANGGKPLGYSKFEAETGIGETAWGNYWVRWGDALTAAGYLPNKMQSAYDDEWVIEQMIALIRELGRHPVDRELKLRHKEQPTFPTLAAVRRRGTKAVFAAKIIDYCSARDGFDDILEICRPIAETKTDTETDDGDGDDSGKNDRLIPGFVYLNQHGSRREYKIGCTTDVIRRHGEISIAMPEEIEVLPET